MICLPLNLTLTLNSGNIFTVLVCLVKPTGLKNLNSQIFLSLWRHLVLTKTPRYKIIIPTNKNSKLPNLKKYDKNKNK